jgi:DNA-binding NtrC family response regulator
LVRTRGPLGLTLRREEVVLCVLGPELSPEEICALASGALKRSPEIPVIALSRGLPASVAFRLARAGIADVIDLPMAPDDLAARVLSRLGRPADRSQEDLLVGESAEVRRVREELARFARTASGVLIFGETGTGKELAARTIHRLSTRAQGPFVALNCGELQPESIRSDLFGHVRGAFTGAIADRPGAFELARDGILFLDEIGELGPSIQPQLLRVLETGVFQPLGAARPRTTNARLVAATHCDLAEASARGRFRADLFERLAVLVTVMPPLRARRSDIPLLARAALDRVSTRLGWSCPHISDNFYERLLSIDYSWPGNVRELFNVVERCLVAGGDSGEPLDRTHVDHALASMQRSQRRDLAHDAEADLAGFPPRGRLSPELTDERRRIAAALRRSGGNVRAAARLLDRHVNTLWSQIDRLELQDYLRQIKI